jgi:hypothetical protein
MLLLVNYLVIVESYSEPSSQVVAPQTATAQLIAILNEVLISHAISGTS